MPAPSMRDAGLAKTLVLPSGAVTVTVATGLDVGPATTQGQFVPNPDGDFLLESPILTTTQLPNAATIVYDIIGSANSNLSSPVVLGSSVLTVTGAGGVGAAAVSVRWDPPTNHGQRYIGYRATGVAATLAATASATLSYVF